MHDIRNVLLSHNEPQSNERERDFSQILFLMSFFNVKPSQIAIRGFRTQYEKLKKAHNGLTEELIHENRFSYSATQKLLLRTAPKLSTARLQIALDLEECAETFKGVGERDCDPASREGACSFLEWGAGVLDDIDIFRK